MIYQNKQIESICIRMVMKKVAMMKSLLAGKLFFQNEVDDAI